jgi:hypothetical protein
MLYGTTDNFLEYLGLNSVEDLPSLKAIEDIIKSGPPEGVSQSDIDFFEEINLMKAQAGEGLGDASVSKDVSNIHELSRGEGEKADNGDGVDGGAREKR